MDSPPNQSLKLPFPSLPCSEEGKLDSIVIPSQISDSFVDSLDPSFVEETPGLKVSGRLPGAVTERDAGEMTGDWLFDPMWADDSEVATRQAVKMVSRIYFPCYFTKIGDDPYGQSKDDATSSCSNKLCKKPAYVGTSDHFTIVVADLSPDINDDLFGARVMLDHKTGQSTALAFVSFRNQKLM